MVSVSRRARPPQRGQRAFDEARHVGQRRAALAADLDVSRKDDGEILLLLGDHAAGSAVQHGDRRAPVALAADAPVSQAIVDLGHAEAALDEPVDGAALGLGHGETVEEPGVDLDPVARVGRAGPARGASHCLDDGQSVLLGEFPVALVLAGHGHDGARAVAHEHVVGDEERDLGAREGVDHARAQAEAPLGAVDCRPLDLGLAGDLCAEGGHGCPLVVRRHRPAGRRAGARGRARRRSCRRRCRAGW